MSDEARRRLIARPYASLIAVDWASLTLPEQREVINGWYRPMVERAKAVYPVTIRQQWIAGVRTDVVVPQDADCDPSGARVLISLHGGSYSFATSGGLAGLAEAVPIAGASRIKVVAVDYKTLPDHKFPAAITDVVAVYKELLRTTRPQSIGIYGCSTGATLTANVVASLQKEGLPAPGAIGLFCGGATKDDQLEGDSYYLAPALMGDPIPRPGERFPSSPYLEGVDPLDPLVAPVFSRDVLARFPLTLLISGTRDVLLSAAVYTHSRLISAGAPADLHIWEGMWHGFLYEVDLPESREAYDVIARFFAGHLQSGTERIDANSCSPPRASSQTSPATPAR
jgi:acetyl esterase/lipase